MVELTADRLVLVDDGTAVDYPGSIEDYIDFILGRNQPKGGDKSAPVVKKDRKAAAQERERAAAVRKAIAEAEAALARLQAQASALDRAMFEPASAPRELAALSMGELARQRAKLGGEIERAEEAWLKASETLEAA